MFCTYFRTVRQDVASHIMYSRVAIRFCCPSHRSPTNGDAKDAPFKASFLQAQARCGMRASASPRCSGRRCGPGLRRLGRIGHDRIVALAHGKQRASSLGCIMRQRRVLVRATSHRGRWRASRGGHDGNVSACEQCGYQVRAIGRQPDGKGSKVHISPFANALSPHPRARLCPMRRVLLHGLVL
jgi:hypothetical protein